MYKKLKLTALGTAFIALGSISPLILAADTGETSSRYALSANVGLFSQYVFRGISYTQNKPAVQGGFDVAHDSGLYAGVWGTNVSDAALNNAVGEIDVYAGYAGSVGEITYDIGLLQFIFPGGRINGTREKYDTLEIYAGLSWSFFNLKYSQTLGDYFGFNEDSFGTGEGGSRGSSYIEANANYEFMPGWSVNAHVGRQKVRSYGRYDFTDYKVGVVKSFDDGWELGLAYIDTTARTSLYTVCDDAGRCKDTGDDKWVAHVKRTF
ncbi:MAG: TorF family putative porin [Azoarcus sp.]|nr:TorF family putative porin [Azoarcus sp.]